MFQNKFEVSKKKMFEFSTFFTAYKKSKKSYPGSFSGLWHQLKWEKGDITNSSETIGNHFLHKLIKAIDELKTICIQTNKRQRLI